MNTNPWNLRREQRQRWSRNAVRRKAELRIERANSPQAEMPDGDAVNIKPRWDFKLNILRSDGQRLQLTLTRFQGKLIGDGICESPKQFGRRLGTMFDLMLC